MCAVCASKPTTFSRKAKNRVLKMSFSLNLAREFSLKTLKTHCAPINRVFVAMPHRFIPAFLTLVLNIFCRSHSYLLYHFNFVLHTNKHPSDSDYKFYCIAIAWLAHSEIPSCSYVAPKASICAYYYYAFNSSFVK